MGVTKQYILTVESDLWRKIKDTVSKGVDLNDTLVQRLAAPIYERSADNRGRIKLPEQYAEKDVVVAVYAVEEERDEPGLVEVVPTVHHDRKEGEVEVRYE